MSIILTALNRMTLSIQPLDFINRYEKELIATGWSSARKGAAYGVFTSWVSLIINLIYSTGFILGFFIMCGTWSHETSISDIIVVSDFRLTKESLATTFSCSYIGGDGLCTGSHVHRLFRFLCTSIIRSSRCNR